MAIISHIISTHLQDTYKSFNSSVHNGTVQLFLTFSSNFLSKSIHSSSRLPRSSFWLTSSPSMVARQWRAGVQTSVGGGWHRVAWGCSLGALLSRQQMQRPWTWWDLGSATAADLRHVKPLATQLPKETWVSTVVTFFIGNEWIWYPTHECVSTILLRTKEIWGTGRDVKCSTF